VSDDWRLRVDLHEEGNARALTDRLEALELEHDLQSSFHDRVFVSRHRAAVLCFTDGREQSERVEQLIRALAKEHGWHVDIDTEHWHESTASWEDGDKALSHDDAQEVAAHRKRIEAERAESEARGYPEFEVRVRFSSHRDARLTEQKLRGEGIPTAHRWKYLVVGANDEDSGHELAKRIEAESPPGTTTTVEGSKQAVLAERPGNPFAILGGLAG
jgi:hypothetical protein